MIKAYKIYILYSEKHKKSYVGFTENIVNRLQKHNNGEVISTKKFIPWIVIFEEDCIDYLSARKREKYYKSGAGRRKLKTIFDSLGLNTKSE